MQLSLLLMALKLDQWERDQEATQLVMNQELEQDKQDYLNDPLLWDADSDKRLQTLESIVAPFADDEVVTYINEDHKENG